MCGGPAAGEGWLDPGSLHRAVLHGLQPDTVYFYTYGSEVGEPNLNTVRMHLVQRVM